LSKQKKTIGICSGQLKVSGENSNKVVAKNIRHLPPYVGALLVSLCQLPGYLPWQFNEKM